MEKWHKLGIKETLSALGSSENGISEEEARRRLEKYGLNQLEAKKKVVALDIFINQFKNAFILLLVAAGILSLIIGDELEAIAIFGIILLNAFLGFFQEFKAEKAMDALQKRSALEAVVIRDGKHMKIPASEIVPGDIIIVDEGSIIPADARIIESRMLKVDEASLTGESEPSKKSEETLLRDLQISDQKNMLFMGTIVTYGKGKAVVTATGMRTEIGKIAKSIQEVEESRTPLETKFSELAGQIAKVAVALVAVVLLVSTIRGTMPFAEILVFALALTVSTIPNSLPIIVTVSLSLGARRLAKQNFLVKKLAAAESLGAVTVICSDKTGTITKNQMTVTDIYFGGKEIKVSGTGYVPKGSFYDGTSEIDAKDIEILLRTAALCNNAELVEKDGKYEILGDPTEGSLIVLAKKGGIDEEKLGKEFSFVQEIPFDSERKMMSVIYKNKEGKQIAYVKGAPDILLHKCSKILEEGKERKISDADREKIMKVNNSFASKSLRVLGFAFREIKDGENITQEDVEKNLAFIGLAGMIDPPREEVKAAIEECKNAGIKVILITGDYETTAKAVAEQIGLLREGDLVLRGEEIEKMSEAELASKIDKIRIISRALPIQKLKIVDALKRKGHIVAMTGDGVNDAPALKKADIGVSMGITGTDVAKEVSKATLVDDNFATIVNAIKEGRNIYDKIIKSAKYLLSCNSGEIITVFFAMMLNLPLPLLPLQILLMNLLTDDIPALGLGSESPEEGVMKRPPRKPDSMPISKRMAISIVIFGLIMATGTTLMFMHYIPEGIEKARTVAFTSLVMFQMFAVISSRSLEPLKKLNPLSNKWLSLAVLLSVSLQVLVVHSEPLQIFFGTVPLSLIDWAMIIAVSSIGFIAMESSKIVSKLISNGKHRQETFI